MSREIDSKQGQRPAYISSLPGHDGIEDLRSALQMYQKSLEVFLDALSMLTRKVSQMIVESCSTEENTRQNLELLERVSADIPAMRRYGNTISSRIRTVTESMATQYSDHPDNTRIPCTEEPLYRDPLQNTCAEGASIDDVFFDIDTHRKTERWLSAIGAYTDFIFSQNPPESGKFAMDMFESAIFHEVVGENDHAASAYAMIGLFCMSVDCAQEPFRKEFYMMASAEHEGVYKLKITEPTVREKTLKIDMT